MESHFSQVIIQINKLLLDMMITNIGSLYAMGVTENRSFGAITPIGGLGFMAGWLVLAFAHIRTGKRL